MTTSKTSLLTKLLSLLLPKAQNSGAQMTTQKTLKTSHDHLKRDIIEHLKLREGVRSKVYKDSLGKLTVGVGHLVLPEDNLKLGDVISTERINSFLDKDLDTSFKAAIAQAEQLGYLSALERDVMIKALVSVNFQLGVGWTKIHKNTWKLMQAGKLKEAAEEVKDSTWYAQTPVRVKDFSEALLKIDRMMDASRKNDPD